MELNFRSVGKQSDHSETLFSPGDDVLSILYQDSDSGAVERFDVLASEEEAMELPGTVICRWRQKIQEKETSEQESRKQALQTTEEIFLSLYEVEDSESVASENEEDDGTRDLLKFFLALQLERKRILRSQGKGKYWHVKGKRMFDVPEIELTPELIHSFQDKLPQLVGHSV